MGYVPDDLSVGRLLEAEQAVPIGIGSGYIVKVRPADPGCIVSQGRSRGQVFFLPASNLALAIHQDCIVRLGTHKMSAEGIGTIIGIVARVDDERLSKSRARC